MTRKVIEGHIRSLLCSITTNFLDKLHIILLNLPMNNKYINIYVCQMTHGLFCVERLPMNDFVESSYE